MDFVFFSTRDLIRMRDDIFSYDVARYLCSAAEPLPPKTY